VDFSFSADQLALRDTVRTLLAEQCQGEVVRAALPPPSGERPGQGIGVGARAEPGAIDRLWSALVDMGVLGLGQPESEGGLGLTEVDWVLIAEEAGYAAAPVPLVEGIVAASSALLDAGEVARADRHRISAAVVDIEPGSGLAFDRMALGAAAELIGLNRRMLDLTVAYVSDRRQFGAPIGSFQAVKHHLADARLQLEFAAPAVYAAAWSLATGSADRERDVSVAKCLASDAARLTAKHALQCHGAIGYTVEYDLHLYFKGAFALAARWGDAAWHRARVGRAIGVE
jgi:alkylation response protein AidB-like acyl-CoA dehydrogenase